MRITGRPLARRRTTQAPAPSVTDVRIVGALACVALVTAACASTSLSPAPGAQTLPGAPDVATARFDGVEMTAQADAWSGDAAVRHAVQPVRVTIHNNSDKLIRLRYGDFELVTPEGECHAALPPFRVEGELLSPVIGAEYAVIATPRFTWRRFHIAPYYRRLYPGIPVWSSARYFYDPFYYDYYHRRFMTAIRPTVEMLALALPEGVIEPGGSVSGYLYFEHVEPGVPAVTFRATLVAVSGVGEKPGSTTFGAISIPFTVTTRH
jgi:hypothetical protein